MSKFHDLELDTKAIGEELRRHRLRSMEQKGCSRISDWLVIFNRATRSKFDDKLLYRLESGKQVMRIDELVKLCMFWFDGAWCEGAIDILMAGVTPEFDAMSVMGMSIQEIIAIDNPKVREKAIAALLNAGNNGTKE